MAWVSRKNGVISGVFANRQPGFADEQLADADPGITVFLNPPAADPIEQWDLTSLKTTFNHENRIRALEGKAPITVAQFKTALKAL
jgi:hypothetical protein